MVRRATGRSDGCHADAAMFVGGLRALLLQSLTAGDDRVAQHSAYREDPGAASARRQLLPRPSHHVRARPSRPSAPWRGSRVHRHINGTPPTVAPTRPPTRTCCGGSMWPRSTASWPPISATAWPAASAGRTGRLRRRNRVRRGEARRARRRRGPRPSCASSWPPTVPNCRRRRGARGKRAFLLIKAPRRSRPSCPTRCSRRPPSDSCRRGRAGRCACPTCRWPENTVGRLGGHGVTAAIHWAMKSRPDRPAATVA